ncbi:MAG: hypothetical protein CMJ83_07200 [Planctomycetes bacterium]|nr:hypothetical protein [Planctomycetota bacterium]
MRASTELHDRVAELLTYPGPDSADAVKRAIHHVSEALPEAGAHLADLATLAADGAPGEFEEKFCHTFDNNADRALEIGWQIWGENYDRGAFLVRMRSLMRTVGVPETAELPDHMSHALRVLGRLPEEAARNLVITTVLPAARKMRDGFKDEVNPYRGALETVVLVLESHVEALEPIDV